MSWSKTLFLFSIAFILGIFISSFFGLSIIVPFFLFTGIALFFTKKRKIFVLGLISIFFAFGFFWHQVFEYREINNELLGFHSFEAKVVKDPSIRENSTHLVLSRVDEKESGKILVITGRYSKYSYGDILSVKGEVRKPDFFNEFDYPAYLAKDGIYYIVFNPEINLIRKEKSFKETIFNFKRKSQVFLYEKFPQPHASMLSALILGNKRDIPELWQQKLSYAGLRHVVAISGLHITVISAIILTLTTSLGRKKSFILSIFTIIFFVFITGMHSSAIRAGIMGSVFLISKIFGRINNSFRLIFFTAAVMLLFNPLLLRDDIGFQLSFLATIGIIELSPFFHSIFNFMPIKIRGFVSMSFAAYILTLPLLINSFNQISLVFPITNILVLPIVYLVMMLAAMFVLVSFISTSLAQIIFFPLWLLVTYIVKVTDIASRFRWSYLDVSDISLTFLFIYILAVLLLIRETRKKQLINIEYQKDERPLLLP
jgi:competence protein ComEC